MSLGSIRAHSDQKSAQETSLVYKYGVHTEGSDCYYALAELKAPEICSEMLSFIEFEGDLPL